MDNRKLMKLYERSRHAGSLVVGEDEKLTEKNLKKLKEWLLNGKRALDVRRIYDKALSKKECDQAAKVFDTLLDQVEKRLDEEKERKKNGL